MQLFGHHLFCLQVQPPAYIGSLHLTPAHQTAPLVYLTLEVPPIKRICLHSPRMLEQLLNYCCKVSLFVQQQTARSTLKTLSRLSIRSAGAKHLHDDVWGLKAATPKAGIKYSYLPNAKARLMCLELKKTLQRETASNLLLVLVRKIGNCTKTLSDYKASSGFEL